MQSRQAATEPATCGAPSRWRWADRCNRPSCPKCFQRFAEKQLAQTIATFGDAAPGQLGWFEIDLGCVADASRLRRPTTNRLRNTVDRQRRSTLGAPWDDIHIRALFGTRLDQLTLSGFIYFGDVAPHALGRVIANAWSSAAVRLVAFNSEGSPAPMHHFGALWAATPMMDLRSFRELRVVVGPRWSKATRHGKPSQGVLHDLDPLPVSVSFDDPSAWWRGW
ncbi:hypothetical protein ACO2Q0_01675 [Phenylobacterium sp. VNQ135]|uniref:hypothetical protein n=1 Tax=Phenylobacterium sp. VNQ135 TaxID=3400922 RepID=UPI003C0E38BB